MKSILTALAAFTLSATAHAECTSNPELAAAKAPKPVPTFGGFEKGKTFTFRVTDKVAASIQGSVVNDHAPVPAAIPNFAVGQSVTFTIGAKGELKATKTNIPFLADAITANQYTIKPSRTNLNPSTAIVFKSGTTPTAVNLNFYSVKAGRPLPTVTTVTYILQ